MAFGRDTLIESFADYLRSKNKVLFRHYIKSPYETRLAEAATFRILQRCSVNPEVADHKGGPDFLCRQGTNRFMVEATSFKTEKVTKDTSLANEAPEKIRVQAYGLLTQQIADKVDAKNSQFAKLGMPGLLAIASDHFGAMTVFDSDTARSVLTSDPYWVGFSTDRMTVDFSRSSFLRQEDGQIVPHNINISAVLLIAVTRYASYVCGALHPAPAYHLDSRPLWEIPFMYVKDWPIEGTVVECAGTMGNQRNLAVPHAPILLATE